MKDLIDKQEMRVRSLVAWYGGKRTLAPIIVGELGRHSMYVEPFCGSMAVLLAKIVSSHEIANDLHGDLINLARVIASERWEELYDRLYRTLCVEGIFDECKSEFIGRDIEPAKTMRDVADEHIERAYVYFVVSWMGRNGMSGTKRQNYQPAKRWTPGGGGGAKRVASAINSIGAWHERLRCVNIMNMDGFELIEKMDDNSKLVMYVDPPYLQGGARTGTITGSGGIYEHEFVEKQHEQLAELLGRFKKARVILSYYEDPRLNDLYPADRWTKRKVYWKKGLLNANKLEGNTKREAPEVLLINGESLEEKEVGLFE